MDPMSQKARLLLERFRDEESLDDARQARLLVALRMRIAAGGPPGGGGDGASSAGPQSALAKVTGSATSKLVVGLLAAGALGGAWSALHRPSPPPPDGSSVHARGVATATPPPPVVVPSPGSSASPESTSRPVAPVVSGPSRGPGSGPTPGHPRPLRLAPAPAVVATAPPLVGEPSVAPETMQIAPAPSPPSISASSDVSATTGSSAAAGASGNLGASTVTVAAHPPPAAAPTASEAVDEEVRLLGIAYSQLRSGLPAKALVTIAEHERRFPDGKLAESRQVARIMALCDVGQAAEARAAGRSFLAAHPGSPFSTRVRAVCAD